MKAGVVAALAGAAVATPFSFPLKNGFPNPNQQALEMVQQIAGGTLPDTALPTKISPALATSFQLIAANELFEVAYFTELYHNITNNVPGYECTDMNRDYVAAAIKRIMNQEELHALAANAAIKSAGGETVGPCQYSFPVSDFQSAIALANTFTDVVLGVLPAVQYTGAVDGGAQGPAVIPLIGSILAQEAEQVGWFRVLQEKFPSAAPFLTPTTPEFALSAIKMFLVPNTCPPVYNSIQSKVKSFPPLSVAKMPTAKDQSVSYSIAGAFPAGGAIAYISGQNSPVTVAAKNVQSQGGKTTFTADFPSSTFADGLTVAAVVNQNKKFTNASEVAMNTLFGPGLIEYM